LKAYYNEIDSYAAQWLRNLISAGHIIPGDVDERSIEDVKPNDLHGYTQCHFFAGIGVWSYALRRAGWSDDRPVWTGSCPCQPFSTAGKRKGTADERHLWPAWFYLIEQCRPSVVFGEQVASKDSYAWLDIVQTDMEAAGYAFGAIVLPAAGFGAPHGRHRIFFVADSASNRRIRSGASTEIEKELSAKPEKGWKLAFGFKGRSISDSSISTELATYALDEFKQKRMEGFNRHGYEWGRWLQPNGSVATKGESSLANPTNGFWRDADWLLCRDGRWRPVEPGTFPLAYGITSRLGRLRAYGNAIVAPVAEAFVREYMNYKSLTIRLNATKNLKSAS
jgi:DNA (cytosine-5)-methyltransferase 1